MSYLDTQSWPEGEAPVFISGEEARSLALAADACQKMEILTRDPDRRRKYSRADIVVRNLLQQAYGQLVRAGEVSE